MRMSTDSLKIFCTKQLGQYKKLSWNKFYKKKFRSMQNFLGLQFSVDDLVKFLELSMFTNASLPYVHLLMKWIRDH